MSQEIILSVEKLTVSFPKNGKSQSVVHGVSFDLQKNEILAVVGESGSGKSVSSLAIMGLLPRNTAQINGSILFNNKDLNQLSDAALRNIRGNHISMIFQEPMSSLNPALRCGYQVMEVLKQHTTLSSSDAKNEVLALFERVKLPRPEVLFDSYPH